MRKKLLLWLLAPAFIFCYAQGASTVTEQRIEVICPTIRVECPDDIAKPGRLVFRAYVTDLLSNEKVGYHWTVRGPNGARKPRITSGQGTASITVAASQPARRGLTATVKVTHIHKLCPNQASCTVGIEASKQ